MPWAVSGRRKTASSSPPSAGDGFEHQVELARLGQRAEGFGVGAQHVRQVLHGGQRDQRAVPLQLVGVFAAEVEELHRLVLGQFEALVAGGVAGDEDALPLAPCPAAADLVVPIALFRFAAIDHVVVEQVVVARTLPDLRVHDDGAVEADHFIGRRGAGRNLQFVVAGDHVAPPRLADVPLQLDAQGAVVPKALQAAVDLARLEQKAPPFAQGH